MDMEWVDRLVAAKDRKIAALTAERDAARRQLAKTQAEYDSYARRVCKVLEELARIIRRGYDDMPAAAKSTSPACRDAQAAQEMTP